MNVDWGSSNPLANLPLEAGTLALESVRIAGLMAAAPILWNIAPVRSRGAVAVILAFVAHGASPQPTHAVASLESLEKIARAAPCELLIGVAMGMVIRLAISAVEITGESISFALGLNAASMFDPHTQAMETALGKVLRMLCISLALVLGAHRVLLAGLFASFRVIPVGTAVQIGFATPILLKLAAAAIGSGVRLALPIVGALLLAQMALAFVSRAAPSMQIFSIGFGVTLTTGFTVVLLALPELAAEVTGDLAEVEGRINSVLTTLTGT